MKSFTHEVKMTFPQKETNRRKCLKSVSLHNQEKDLDTLYNSWFFKRKRWLIPYFSVTLEGVDAHTKAFVLASADRTPELTQFSYSFLLYRELYKLIKTDWLQSVNRTGLDWFYRNTQKVCLKLLSV